MASNLLRVVNDLYDHSGLLDLKIDFSDSPRILETEKKTVMIVQ